RLFISQNIEMSLLQLKVVCLGLSWHINFQTRSMSVDDSAYLLHLQRVNDYFRDNIEGVLVTLRQIEKLEPNAKLQKYEEGLNDTDPYFAKEYYFNKNGGQIYSGNSPPTEPLEHAHIDLMVAIIQLQGRSIDFQ